MRKNNNIFEISKGLEMINQYMLQVFVVNKNESLNFCCLAQKL